MTQKVFQKYNMYRISVLKTTFDCFTLLPDNTHNHVNENNQK